MYSATSFKKTPLRRAVLFALSINSAAFGLSSGVTQAAQNFTCTAVDTTGNNFTMLDSGSGITGGENNVHFTWDGSLFDANSDYTGPSSTSNATLVPSTPFSGYMWTAHAVQIFGPGTYTFDSIEGGNFGMTVGPDQLGAHMLFDWNGNLNIDVAVVWNKNTTFSGPMVTDFPSGVNDNTTVWMLSSTDPDSDGINGIPMPDGPFADFNANFSLKGTLGGTCAPTVDTAPDAFSFTDVTNAIANAIYESNTITVSGLGVTPPDPTVTTSISITNGQYSIDGGITWVTTAGTVGNGDTIKVRGTAPANDGQTTNVVLNIGGVTGTFRISTPAIATQQGSNFTMLNPSGGVAGGTNDVVASWDGTYDDNSTGGVNSTNFSRMSLSSVTAFFQNLWTAHHIRVFGPGTYTIDTTCTVADLENGISNCNHPLQGTPGGPSGSLQTQQYYTFTVGPNQIAAHMLFDWNVAANIDVVDVWNVDQKFGPSPMHTGAATCNNPGTLWDLMSTDWDGDGKNGAKMIDGPFQGFGANFNIRLPGSPILSCSAYAPTVNVDDPSSASGCSISPMPVNTLERADWWLVAGFLAWLGALRKRFKHQA